MDNYAVRLNKAAERLSSYIGTVKAEDFEQLYRTDQKTNIVEIVNGKLSGASGWIGRDLYGALFLLHYNGEKLLSVGADISQKSGLELHVINALEKLIVLADDPASGERVNDLRELKSIEFAPPPLDEMIKSLIPK